MKRLRGLDKLLLKIVKRKLLKYLQMAITDDNFRLKIVERLNKKINIPELTEEQEGKLINFIIVEASSSLLDLID